MRRFYGILGFAGESVEIKPGVWSSGITEKSYTGTIKVNKSSVSYNDSVNAEITSNSIISIIADPYACDNYASIKYVKIGDGQTKWIVKSVDYVRPRLTLYLGGVYNTNE